ncbi:hypothetical protein ACJJTC_001814 [Scirpophaga incertulas]
MSNGILRSALYLLLDIIEFMLNSLFYIAYFLLFTTKIGIGFISYVIMTENSKKQKRDGGQNANKTIAIRGVINVNWQNFLNSTLINENKIDKSTQEIKKDAYTGVFRRARKKKPKVTNAFENNLKTLDLNQNSGTVETQKIEIQRKRNKLTKFVAMDCEMVGVGYEGNDHMVARVSLVNKFGDCIYDKFVKAREEVVDYRTNISGVRKEDLLNGEDFHIVQKEVAEILRGRILVGHAVKKDLSVLFLAHPKRNIRDTSTYKPLKNITKGSTPSLKRLAKEILGIDIQHGEHSSVEDANAAMQIYCSVAKNWEASLSGKRGYTQRLVNE